MASKNTIQDITLTIQSGGMIAFEKTGVYPVYLLFHSPQLRNTWRFRHINETQNGVMKVKGKVAFNYFFDGIGCKIQSVTNGVIIDAWEIDEILLEKRD